MKPDVDRPQTYTKQKLIKLWKMCAKCKEIKNELSFFFTSTPAAGWPRVVSKICVEIGDFVLGVWLDMFFSFFLSLLLSFLNFRILEFELIFFCFLPKTKIDRNCRESTIEFVIGIRAQNQRGNNNIKCVLLRWSNVSDVLKSEQKLILFHRQTAIACRRQRKTVLISNMRTYAFMFNLCVCVDCWWLHTHF